MEGLLAASLQSIKELPGNISYIVTLSILAFGAWIYWKKTNIDEMESINSVHKSQLDGLMHQVEMLSSELTKAREQLQIIHEQNVDLMRQVRESNQRIRELEDMVALINK